MPRAARADRALRAAARRSPAAARRSESADVHPWLWSDAIAADIADAFLAAPGGLYDADVAARYRRTILEAGSTRPIAEGFREFRGRDPDPDALFRRFDLLPPKRGR